MTSNVFIAPKELIADLKRAEESLRSLVIDADEVEQERLNAKANAVAAGARRVDVELERHNENADEAYRAVINLYVTETTLDENIARGDKYHTARLQGRVEGYEIVLDYVRRSRA